MSSTPESRKAARDRAAAMGAVQLEVHAKARSIAAGVMNSRAGGWIACGLFFAVVILAHVVVGTF